MTVAAFVAWLLWLPVSLFDLRRRLRDWDDTVDPLWRAWQERPHRHAVPAGASAAFAVLMTETGADTERISEPKAQTAQRVERVLAELPRTAGEARVGLENLALGSRT